MMADPVRQRVIPRVALPKTYGQPAAAKRDEDAAPSYQPRESLGAQLVDVPVRNLSAHIGSRVRITNALSQAFVGEVYMFNTQLVLSTGPNDYHIIPATKITKVEVISSDNTTVMKAVNGATAVEMESQIELKEQKVAKPPAVSNTGYSIFLMLDKTRVSKSAYKSPADKYRLPVRWHNKSIVVFDNVLIEPPYDVEDCKAPAKHVKQLERVKELVKNELEKMLRDNDNRKGG